MDSNNNTKQYSEEQIQFLQKLVKEQRDLDQQIKILKKAHQERETRKKQLDNTIIKYFKTNDISHINLKDTNCRIECVTVKSKTGLSQKYVSNMLEELLKDEDLSRDVLDYILSERQITHKFKLKTIENYDKKRKRKAPVPKEDKKFTTEDKGKLVLKLKDRFNGKTKPIEEINIQITDNQINEQQLTSNVLQQNNNKEHKEHIPSVSNPIETEVIDIQQHIKHSTTSNTNIIQKNNLKKDVSSIIDESTINEIIKPSNENITINISKPNKPNNNKPNNNKPNSMNSNIDNFINQQMEQIKELSSGKNVTDLMSLYKDLIDRSNSIGNVM